MSISIRDLEDAANPPLIALVPAKRSTRELRVLQVFSVLSMGGAETWLMSLLRYFRETEKDSPVKVTFDILLTGGEKAVFDDEAIALGARLYYVPFSRRNTFGFIREFRHILSSGKYDVIHDHQDYIAGLHFLMGLGHLPVVRVAHIHNALVNRSHYANGLSRQLVASIGKHLLPRLSSHIMGTSRQIVSEHGFNESHPPTLTLGVAHCGFDVAQYQGNYEDAHEELCREFTWDKSAKIVLFVGRLESGGIDDLGPAMPQKNPAFALEVVRNCIAADQDVRLLMVGAGETRRSEFEAQVKAWGLDQRIRFLGVRHDVPRLMLGANLLLFPSLAEGLGMVAVEAQAAGLRVLASDTVPRECLVVPGMVEFLPVTDLEQWTNEALRMINLNRADHTKCNALVNESAFSIKNSSARLIEMYGKAATLGIK